jgi:hypothetical protein
MSYLFSFSQRNTGNWSPGTSPGTAPTWDDQAITALDNTSAHFTNIFAWPDVIKNILPPHSMLNPDPASYYALNERIVAAESCWFAAKVMVIFI